MPICEEFRRVRLSILINYFGNWDWNVERYEQMEKKKESPSYSYSLYSTAAVN